MRIRLHLLDVCWRAAAYKLLPHALQDAVLDALVEHAASCARFDSKCERFPTSTICLRLTVVYVCEILLQKKILSPCLTFIFLEKNFVAGMHAPDDETSRSSTLTFSFLLARAQGEAKAPGFLGRVNEYPIGAEEIFLVIAL